MKTIKFIENVKKKLEARSYRNTCNRFFDQSSWTFFHAFYDKLMICLIYHSLPAKYPDIQPHM